MSILTSAVSALPTEWLINYSIDIAQTILDKYVKGEKLNDREIKIVQEGYISARIWLKDLVEQSKTNTDDKGYKTFMALCEDTAQEGGWPLPELADWERPVEEPVEIAEDVPVQ